MLEVTKVSVASPVPIYCSIQDSGQPYGRTDNDTASVKIVLFGDTHLGFNYDLEDLYKVIDKINSQSPDIIVFSGDLIDNLNSYDGDTRLISEALSELSAPGGKYAVHGNHDYELSSNDPYTEIMEAGGFSVLINSSLYLPQYNINVFGITDCLIGSGDPSILTAAGPDTFNLVICHEPDIFDRISDFNATLMLSGHSHGGQVNIPLYTEYFLPALGTKYVNGMFTSYRTNGAASQAVSASEHSESPESSEIFERSGCSVNTLYVTKGIGTTKLPLRFRAKPEIVSITLE